MPPKRKITRKMVEPANEKTELEIMNAAIAELGGLGDVESLVTSEGEGLVPITSLLAASMLVNLGAFLGDLGILFQQGQAAPPTPTQKRDAAKQALIAELDRLHEQVSGDAGLPAPQKRASLRKIDQAIGGLKACNQQGLSNAATRDIPLVGDPHGKGRPWEDFWWQVWLMSMAISAKAMWDTVPPANQQLRRVVYDAQSGKISFQLGTTHITVIAWKVHANKRAQAQQVARDLDAMFKRCDYPDKAMADRIADLRKP